MRKKKQYFVDKNEKEIAGRIGVDDDYLSRWHDYRWQLDNRITNLDSFEKFSGIKFPKREREERQKAVEKFPMSITPYYLSLINVENYESDPIFKQAVPDPKELRISKYDIKDPLSEDEDSPVPCITHRYPDRALFLISSVCSMYCRHCTRKRKVGHVDSIPDKKTLKKAIDYLRDTPSIRDVLFSGGDPFLLPDEYLDWILGEVESIEHIEVMRIGTRVPAVLPYRITDGLIEVLKKHQPLWINTHFNHPRELTKSARTALAKLADAGVPLGNQSVLLAGVNDCPRVMKKLIHKLVQNRVRPYYIYQCDLSEGLTHFRTPVSKGIEIMENLIGHTSGFAVPRYVIDAPGGGGKIPVAPTYMISMGTNKVVLRNYEGVITTYEEPDSYEPHFCDRNCPECDLHLSLEPAEEYKATGIAKLLSNVDEGISLTPGENERIERRKNGH
jgi:lysine 2,3-aminomutase